MIHIAVAGPTFHEEIAPIIYENCTHCHRPEQAAPFSLTSYHDVKKRARIIGEVVEEKLMPPWHADRDAIEYANDRSLTDEQIKRIVDWVADGAPEGDPAAKIEPPTFPGGWQLGTPDVVAQMPEPFSVPADGEDIYRNFVMPLNFTEDTWISAIEPAPGSPEVVHHVLFFLDTSGRRARRADAADPAPGFDGFGGMTMRMRYLGGWDLGTQVAVFPHDLAVLVPAGSDLVIEVHYHPIGKVVVDQTKIGLHISEKPTARPWTIIPIPPAFGILDGINIPAGEKTYERKNSLTLPVDVEVFGIAGHAHYLAQRMETTATLPSGKTIPLLKISDWNFAWQEDYYFKEVIKLPAGTRLDTFIAWDNSAANPYQFNDPPQAVRWGPQTTDEMGTITLSIMLGKEEDKQVLVHSLRTFIASQLVQRAFENDRASVQQARDGGIPIAKSLEDTLFLQAPDWDEDGDGILSQEEAMGVGRFLGSIMPKVSLMGID